MKKISIFLLFSFVSGLLFAQVNIQKQATTRTVVSYMGTKLVEIQIGDSATQYYYQCGTTNQFDDVYLLSLGSSIEESIETLNSLKQLIETAKKGESYKINDNTSAFFSRKGLIALISKGYAGVCYLATKTIDKFLKELEKEKVK